MTIMKLITGEEMSKSCQGGYTSGAYIIGNPVKVCTWTFKLSFFQMIRLRLWMWIHGIKLGQKDILKKMKEYI